MLLFYYDFFFFYFCLLLILKLSNVGIYYGIDSGFSFYLISILRGRFLYIKLLIGVEFCYYSYFCPITYILFNISVLISYSNRVVKKRGKVV